MIERIPETEIVDFLGKNGGFLNIASLGETTWYCFAQSIAKMAKAKGLPVVTKHIEPISTADYWGKAARPLNSRLNLTRLEHIFGIVPAHWTEGLEEVMKRADVQT